MKLRNKKTGEILLIGNIIVENPERVDCEQLTKCRSLAELNDEWEDYKPKAFYYINENGGVLHYIPSDPEAEDETYINYQKQIGNYFETKEEAEKAVEKLKAWKRLKDRGFKITLHDCEGNAWLEANWGNLQGDYSDVLLLFGGEE